MILRLGFAELYVTNLEVSRKYYVNTLGFIEAKQIGKSLYLRGIEEFDEYSLILTEKAEPALANFGLRVSSIEYLQELKEWHDEKGIATDWVEEGIHEGLGACLKVKEPNGHNVVFYHSLKQINVRDENGKMKALPMRYTHQFNGVPPIKIDHMNIRVESVDEALKYWNEGLNFSISEFIQDGDEKFAAWTRRAPFTHDVALVKANRPALHHVAFIVDGVSGVVRTADVLADAGYRDHIEYGPGRHGVSNAFFLYITDPDGHRIEIYANDYARDLDAAPIGWTLEEYNDKGRLWWGSQVPDTFYKNLSEVSKDFLKEKVTK
ncbi:3,4-dihydroxyphenylacetate 2,3-dioxygenase [Ureibacillus composti]